MQFPNPIVKSLIIYDNNGNAVVIIGPGPFIKIVNPTSGAELDLDAGTTFPEAVFWNSGHTAFGKISLEVATFSTRQMLIFRSPPDQTFTIPGNPDVQPRLFLTSEILLGNVLPVNGDNDVGGRLRLDESSFDLFIFDSVNPSHILVGIKADRSIPNTNQPDLYFFKGTTGGVTTTGPFFQWTSASLQMEQAWNAPVFQNGWSNVGGVNGVAGYRIDPTRRLWLKGVIIGGTKTDGTVIFNLPAGYRPASTRVFPLTLISAGATQPNVQLRCNTAGDVTVFGISATTTGNMGLDGSSFALDD